MADSPKFNRNYYSNDPVAGFADIDVIEDSETGEPRFVTTIQNPTWADGSDAYANNFDAFISIASAVTNSGVLFKAFITTFNETYTPNFNPTEVFGRTDPIYQYKNTSRSITLAWKIPAASEGEAYENLGKVQKLITMLYPSYDNTSNALTISKAPIIKLQVMNLVTDARGMIPEMKGGASEHFNGYKISANSKPLLGIITSCNINHNLEGTDGAFHKRGAKGTILPKLIDVNISFQPLHQQTLTNTANSFPYNVVIADDEKTDDSKRPLNQSGMTLSQQREAKIELEKKRRKASSAQQNLDRRSARALRAYDKYMNAEEGSGQERRALRRSVNLETRMERAGRSYNYEGVLDLREEADDYEREKNIDAILTGY